MIINNLRPFGVEVEIDSATGLRPLAVKAMLEAHKLVVIRGLAPLGRESFLEMVLKLAPANNDAKKRILHWQFGPVMELKVNDKAENYLFSNQKVPFHWDGAFHIEPAFLAFNCIEAPESGAGGETLFCDTEKVYSDLSREERKVIENCRMTFETEKKAHYGGYITVPLIQRHPRSQSTIMRYAEGVETDLNPVRAIAKGCDGMSSNEFQNWMHKLIYSPKYCYEHKWENGDILIADNFSLIHGRHAFSKHTGRHIRRIQVLGEQHAN